MLAEVDRRPFRPGKEDDSHSATHGDGARDRQRASSIMIRTGLKICCQ